MAGISLFRLYVIGFSRISISTGQVAAYRRYSVHAILVRHVRNRERNKTLCPVMLAIRR